MTRIAIIPARGGSKRIPRKNIKDFFGKPIIAYAIENALKSGLFSNVFVSTDDEEIAAIARKYGAEVPILRSSENSTDFATTSDVLLEVLDYLLNHGKFIETACCIYPTSVLLNSDDLITASGQFDDQEAPVLMTCVAYSHPVQRSFTIQQNQIKLQFPEHINSRSQDLEKVFHDTGSFYFFRVADFKKEKTLWQKRITPFIMDERKVQDIDTEEDWLMAELKFKLSQNEKL